MTQLESTTRNRIADMYPLSPMQKGLLFHSLLSPEDGLYMPHVILDLRGDLNTKRLRSAFEDALAEHAVLRTGVFWEEREEPFQIVFREATLPWQELDWRKLSDAEAEQRLEAYLAISHSTAFELKKAPLHRVTLVRLSRERWTLIWAYHHIILDGWSAARVLEQVFAQSVLGPKALAALPRAGRFGDYVAWLAKRSPEDSERFWRSYLGASEAVSTLPFEPPEDAGSEPRPRQHELALDEISTRRLRVFAESCAITLNTLVMGTFALLMGRYGHSRQVRFGKTVSGRPTDLPSAHSMVGLFINTLPVALELPPDRPIGTWLGEVQRREATTIDHEHVPLRDIQEWINQGKSLFDCLFVFESYPAPKALDGASIDLALDGIHFEERTHFPLLLQVAEGTELLINARYDGLRFQQRDVEHMLEDFKELLLSTISDSETPIGRLFPGRTCADAHLQIGRSDERADSPPLLDWLESAGERWSERRAVWSASGHLSYAELHQRANALAAHLVDAGIGPEDGVAIHLERSAPLIIAVLATLKAGAVYLPLDPEQPRARLEKILESAKPKILLHDPTAPSALDPASLGCRSVNATRFERTALSPPEKRSRPGPNNAAYVIYTSGSTGQPKGVVNTHEALRNRLAWMQARYDLTEEDVVLHKTSIGFDVSVWELTWPFLVGATLALAEPGRHGDAAYLREVIPAAGVTTLHFVPSMLGAFLESADPADGSSIRRVICSGEALAPTHVRTFFERLPKSELHNLYGPTEAAIDVTSYACRAPKPGASIPIGRAIASTDLFILDSEGNPVGQGIPGELHISGVGLARGYLGDPARTAESFVPNPFSEGGGHDSSAVMYRTGDLARFRDDGEIEYLGRVDHQLKLNGIRVEPGEIESALRECEEVVEAVVQLRSDAPGEPRLTAYLTRTGPHTTLSDDQREDIRSQLLERLPAPMIPTHYVALEALPFLSNGKIDRQSLPAPESAGTPTFEPPRNETERLLATIWSEVLGIDPIGVQDDFIMLGGHSLNATRVNALLRKQLEIDLPLTAHFRYLTVAELAEYIDALRAIEDSPDRERPDEHVEFEF